MNRILALFASLILATGVAVAEPTIEQGEADIRLLRLGKGALYAQAFHRIVTLPKAGHIREVYGVAFKIQRRLQDVAGGAWDVGDDCHITQSKPVQEAGLTSIRRAYQRHLQAISKTLAALTVGKVTVNLISKGRKARKHTRQEIVRYFLIRREVDLRLDHGERFQKARMPTAVELPESTVHLPPCLPGLLPGLRGDQIGQPFGGGEIHLAVQECPPAELAWLRWANILDALQSIE